MERLSWIIQVNPKCNNNCPYQKTVDEEHLSKEENKGSWNDAAEDKETWTPEAGVGKK